MIDPCGSSAAVRVDRFPTCAIWNPDSPGPNLDDHFSLFTMHGCVCGVSKATPDSESCPSVLITKVSSDFQKPMDVNMFHLSFV
jgi:hypothetical protein